MKTKLTIMLALMIPGILFAQDEKYLGAMGSTIEKLYSSAEISDLDVAINKFRRIGQAEATEWEPYYYASFGTLMKTGKIIDTGEKDELLNSALELLSNAEDISPNNSEILAMKGYILMMKLSVDPATRGQSLSPEIMQLFGKAMAIDPSNPRAILLMAQMQMGTAQFFGTGIEEPCGMVDRSVQLFEKENPTSVVSPAWGEATALQLQRTCSSSLSEKGEK